jgi:hypothetical protein
VALPSLQPDGVMQGCTLTVGHRRRTEEALIIPIRPEEVGDESHSVIEICPVLDARQVTNSSGSSSAIPLIASTANPGVFTYEAGGGGQAKATNQDGSPNADGSIFGTDKPLLSSSSYRIRPQSKGGMQSRRRMRSRFAGPLPVLCRQFDPRGAPGEGRGG